jgi:hypothetical protein
MKKLLVFVVFIFTLVFPTSVKASTVNYISPQPPTILSQNSTLSGVQVSVYIPVFSGYDSSYMTNVSAEMRSCLGCGVTSIGISPNLAHNGLIFSSLAYDTQHTLSIRVITQTEQLIVSKIEFRTISSLTTPTTAVAPTITTTTLAPVTTTTVAPITTTTITTPVAQQNVCVPTTNKLFKYDYTSWVKITDHGGTYDPSNYGWWWDHTRSCKVSPIVKILIKDNFIITEIQPTNSAFHYEFNYFNLSVPNCWEIARVSAYGQSEWSNQVCYTPPPVPQTTVPQTTVPSYTSYTPSTVAPYTYNTFVRTGAICSDGWRSKATGSGACSWHGGVSKWLGSNYSTYKSPSSSYGTSTYKLPSLSYGSSNCVGMCYGSPSKVNGLPRNTYVSGYLKSNGTWVNGYTKSKP